MNILRIDGSMRRNGSISRDLTGEVISHLVDLSEGETTLHIRDLADGIELVDEAWINANFTDPAERTPAQKQRLAYSDQLVGELQTADAVVIGLPIYNFGVPAAVKAWVDMIARARLTFRYTSDGPEGLLTGKTAYLVVASGGTPLGSEIDFATGFMRHALKFVGITDVRVIDASAAGSGLDEALARARGQIGAE